MKSVIIIPTLNPDEKIIRLVEDLIKEDFNMIVIVNDGSKKECNKIFEKLRTLGCKTVNHKINMGKGEAIKSGIKYANRNFKNIVGYITVDGDYQHLPKDVKKVAQCLEKDETKIILGERSFKGKNIPIKSKIGNIFSAIFLKFQTGVYIEDTQTGLRGIPCKYKDFALKVEGNRYEYEMNFLKNAIEKKIEFEMVEIDTLYDDNNRGTHFRPLKDAYLIYEEPIKFTLISFTSAIIDVGIFSILYKIFTVFLLKSMSINGISAIANVIARISSGAYNFFMNKNVSFKSKGHTKRQLLQYVVLFLIQMNLSTLLISILSKLTVNITITKIVIDMILFFANYMVEKKFIFNKNNNN